MAAAVLLTACGPEVALPVRVIQTRAPLTPTPTSVTIDGPLPDLPAQLPPALPTPHFAVPTPAPTATPAPPRASAASVGLEMPICSDVGAILRGMVLEPYVDAFVAAGKRYGVSPCLTAALSIREASGGAAACGFNAWGWGNCDHEPSFASWEEGIDRVTRAFSEPPYAGHDVVGQLCIWKSGNPGCVRDGDLPYVADILGLFR